MKKLTPRHARFVDEYMIDLNARQAAIRAGHSQQNAENNSYKLLQRPEIAAAIAQRQQALTDRLDLTAEQVLRQLMRIAFADIGRLYNTDGSMKDMPEVDADTRAAIAWVTVEERNATRVRRVRMKDSIAALTLLGRHLNLWRDAVERDSAPEPGPAEASSDDAFGRAMKEAQERYP